MLWFTLAVMTGLAVLVGPLAAGVSARARRRRGREVAFYRAQLAEIERDVDRGQLPRDEAAAARAEAGRRLIAASAARPRRSPASKSDLATPPRRRGADPDRDPGDRARRLQLFRPSRSARCAARRRKTDTSSPGGVGGGDRQDRGPSRGYRPTTRRAGRCWRRSICAWAATTTPPTPSGQLLRLKGENGELRADYGEALVAAAGGVVTADARAAFEKALADTPGLPKARFYLALAAEQDGDTEEGDRRVTRRCSPDAERRRALDDRGSARLATLKGEPAQARRRRRPALAGIEGISAEQQQMIRGMVAAARDAARQERRQRRRMGAPYSRLFGVARNR